MKKPTKKPTHQPLVPQWLRFKNTPKVRKMIELIDAFIIVVTFFVELFLGFAFLILVANLIY